MAKKQKSKKTLVQPVSLSDLADVSFDDSGNLIFLPKSFHTLDEGEEKPDYKQNDASDISEIGELEESNDKNDENDPDVELTPDGLVALVKKGAVVLYRCNVCEALDLGKTVYAGGTYDLDLVNSYHYVLPFQEKPQLFIINVY